MPLRITRAVDSVIFGGWNLDPNDLNGSCDHRIWVRRVRDTTAHQDALVNVFTAGGTTEELLSVGDDPVEIDRDVYLGIVGIEEFFPKPEKRCRACGRGATFKKMIPQAGVALSAPKNYELIRHDARKKK